MTPSREARLVDVLAVLRHEPLSAGQVREALASAGGAPSPATVYADLALLKERGLVTSRKRRKKVPGKSGHRERVFAVIA